MKKRKGKIIILLFLVFIVTCIFAYTYSYADGEINPEDLPKEVKIEFKKAVTVEKRTDFRIILPGHNYIGNNTHDTNFGVTVENTGNSYIYLKGRFNETGQYLINIAGNYFLFNVIEIDDLSTEQVEL